MPETTRLWHLLAFPYTSFTLFCLLAYPSLPTQFPVPVQIPPKTNTDKWRKAAPLPPGIFANPEDPLLKKGVFRLRSGTPAIVS